MVRPNDLNGHCDIHLFKESIKPMWEDEKNKMGGKWIVRLRKGEEEQEEVLKQICRHVSDGYNHLSAQTKTEP